MSPGRSGVLCLLLRRFLEASRRAVLGTGPCADCLRTELAVWSSPQRLREGGWSKPKAKWGRHGLQLMLLVEDPPVFQTPIISIRLPFLLHSRTVRCGMGELGRWQKVVNSAWIAEALTLDKEMVSGPKKTPVAIWFASLNSQRSRQAYRGDTQGGYWVTLRAAHPPLCPHGLSQQPLRLPALLCSLPGRGRGEAGIQGLPGTLSWGC